MTKSEREAQKQYWAEHSTEPTVEAMMLDSSASEIDRLDRPEVRTAVEQQRGIAAEGPCWMIWEPSKAGVAMGTPGMPGGNSACTPYQRCEISCLVNNRLDSPGVRIAAEHWQEGPVGLSIGRECSWQP
jgi:hypothetical protein